MAVFMNVIHLYVPTDHTEEEIEEFYSHVDNSMLLHEISMVIRYLKVGDEPNKDSYRRVVWHGKY